MGRWTKHREYQLSDRYKVMREISEKLRKTLENEKYQIYRF